MEAEETPLHGFGDLGLSPSLCTHKLCVLRTSLSLLGTFFYPLYNVRAQIMIALLRGKKDSHAIPSFSRSKWPREEAQAP